MAIYHLSAQIVTRQKGSSALCAAAYRHGSKMYFEREDRTVSYTGKHEVAITGIMLPDESPQWLRNGIDGRDERGASEFIWNAVENFERRKDAQLAREIDAALPVELTQAQNVAVIEAFARRFTDRGMIVDWAFHDLKGNPHVHMMITLRPLTEDGFGAKKVPVLDQNGEPLRKAYGKGKPQIVYEQWAGDRRGEDLLAWREAWADVVNGALALAGHEQRIDHRSHEDRGIELEATEHMGVHASGMKNRGKESERADREAEKAERNAAYLEANPDHILHVIADKKAVFTPEDIEQELLRYVPDRERREAVTDRIYESDELVYLAEKAFDPESGLQIDSEKLTTRDMLAVEREMAERAGRMIDKKGFDVKERHVERAINQMNEKLSEFGGKLSEEQETAIRAVTGETALSAVVGLAGTGKSTMLEAAREAWEGQGYRVRGVALAGKAVEELQDASGIQSRTIASLEARLNRQKDLFQKGDILVVDEAGMVGSRQLARLLRAAEAGEAKVVLVGDPDQLQPISAGAAFRAIIERTGFAEISGIRRQKEAWMREASINFARGNIAEAIQAYRDHGADRSYRRKEFAITGIANSLLKDRRENLSVLALAHSNKDVRAINDAVREERLRIGELKDETSFQTSRGKQSFAKDDRIVFLQNDHEIGVKNGMLGTVTATENGRLQVKIDDGPEIAFSDKRYGHVDHGYAVTVHKSQGATVDSVHFLATRSVNKNLAYVAMTRHRHKAAVHYSWASFNDIKSAIGGTLINHGSAPYENNPENRDSYFVTLKTGEDNESTIWGVDLERAIEKAGSQLGDEILLKHQGAQPVQLPDGKIVERNSWQVTPITGELGPPMGGIVEAMSRPDEKGSTLDFVCGIEAESAIAFGERRGFASRLPIAKTIKGIIARQAQRLSKVFDRFVQSAPTRSSDVEWMITPETKFDRSVEQVAKERALASKQLAKSDAELKGLASEIYRDADVAMKRFRSLLDAPREDLKHLTQIFKEEPERFGDLKGATGMMAGRAGRAERADALQKIGRIRQRVRDFKGLYDAVLTKEAEAERSRRERLGVGVPALSSREMALLDKLDAAARKGDKEFRDAFDDAKASDSGGLSRISAFHKALESRLGGIKRYLAAFDRGEAAEQSTLKSMIERHRPKLEKSAVVHRQIEKTARQERTQQTEIKR